MNKLLMLFMALISFPILAKAQSIYISGADGEVAIGLTQEPVINLIPVSITELFTNNADGRLSSPLSSSPVISTIGSEVKSLLIDNADGRLSSQLSPAPVISTVGSEVTGLLIDNADGVKAMALVASNSLGTAPVSVAGTLQNLTNGPHQSLYTIPENSTGYIYYKMTAQGNPLSASSDFPLALVNSSERTVWTLGRIMQGGILRISVPGNDLASGGTTTFSLGDSLLVGNDLYVLDAAPPSFTVQSSPQLYDRTFEFFAQGSAGISGSVGSIGLGASIAAAQISVKGTGATDLRITVNNEHQMTFDRRLEYGVSASVSVPSIDAIVGDVNIGANASVSAKTIVGQALDFSGLQLTPDQRKMAEAGFILQSLSLGTSDLSPTFGIMLQAVTSVLNNSSGIKQVIQSGVFENYWGAGFEGSLGLGFGASFGPVKVGLLGRSISGAFMGEHVAYSNPSEAPFGSVSATSFSQAASFDFSALSFHFLNDDHVDLSPDSYGLFDETGGMEAAEEAYFGPDNSLTDLRFSLEGGAGYSIFSGSANIFYLTQIDIPGQYADSLVDSSLAVAGIFDPKLTVPIGADLPQDFARATNFVSSHFVTQPVAITSFEERGRGFEIPFSLDLDGALGVGIGVSLGFNLSYYDQVSFPKKFTELYANGQNYLMYSSSYSDSMSTYNIDSLLTTVLLGAASLTKAAFNSLLTSAKALVSVGESFAVNSVNSGGKLIGNIFGTTSQSGTWLATTYSPSSPRVWQQSFAVPVVKNMYYSTRVFHKRFVANTVSLQNVTTTLVLVSNVLKVSFIPSGDTATVDSVSSPFNIKMVIDTSRLSINGLSLADTSRLNIYRYNPNSNGWILVGGTRTKDAMSASVTHMSNYAIGVELTNASDSTAPSIYNYGPQGGSPIDTLPKIYAHIKDNPYGVGVDLAKTFMIANGDTLDISYVPTDSMIYYDLTPEDSLNGKVNVEIVTSDYDGNTASVNFSFALDVTGVKSSQVPRVFKLFQNYPNPFNPMTTIEYSVAKQSDVRIVIYNVIGQYVTTLVNKVCSPGDYKLQFDASRFASGVYFCTYAAKPVDGGQAYTETRKMMLLK